MIINRHMVVPAMWFSYMSGTITLEFVFFVKPEHVFWAVFLPVTGIYLFEILKAEIERRNGFK